MSKLRLSNFQVADFGLLELRKSSESYSEGEEEGSVNQNKLLWVAPEILRDEKLNVKGTQKGDIYSFGKYIFIYLKVTFNFHSLFKLQRYYFV